MLCLTHRRRVALTIAAARVAGGPHSAIEVKLTQANLPAALFDALTGARADGGDLRCSSDALGAALLPLDVVQFDRAAGKAELWVKLPNLSATGNAPHYLWWQEPASGLAQPAPTEPAGRNAVWSAWRAVLRTDAAAGLLDRTGVSRTITVVGTPVVQDDVALGRALAFDGLAQRVTLAGPFGGAPWSGLLSLRSTDGALATTQQPLAAEPAGRLSWSDPAPSARGRLLLEGVAPAALMMGPVPANSALVLGWTQDGTAATLWRGASAAWPAPVADHDFAATGALGGDWTLSRSGSASTVNGSGTIVSVAVNAPRFWHDPGTLAPNGLLIERAATNQSVNLSQWSSNNSSFEAASGTAPDGSAAQRLRATGNWDVSRRLSGFYPGNGTWCCSLFGRPDTGSSRIALDMAWEPFSRAPFDVATGVQQSAGTVGLAARVGAAAYPGGWQRIFGSHAVSGNLYSVVDARIANETAQWGANTVGDAVRLFGVQVEAGERPTSYIPTTTGAVSRGADLCTAVGSFANSAHAGCLELRFPHGTGPTEIITLWQSDDGTEANRITLAWNGPLSRYELTVRRAGVTQAQLAIAGDTQGLNRLAWSAANGDFGLAVNGTLASRSSAGLLPTGQSVVRLGASHAGVVGGVAFARVRRWISALDDLALHALSAGQASVPLVAELATAASVPDAAKAATSIVLGGPAAAPWPGRIALLRVSQGAVAPDRLRTLIANDIDPAGFTTPGTPVGVVALAPQAGVMTPHAAGPTLSVSGGSGAVVLAPAAATMTPQASSPALIRQTSLAPAPASMVPHASAPALIRRITLGPAAATMTPHASSPTLASQAVTGAPRFRITRPGRDLALRPQRDPRARPLPSGD
jgi:hypothetical protein